MAPEGGSDQNSKGTPPWNPKYVDSVGPVEGTRTRGQGAKSSIRAGAKQGGLWWFEWALARRGWLWFWFL
jgi:hypothetical protein